MTSDARTYRIELNCEWTFTNSLNCPISGFARIKIKINTMKIEKESNTREKTLI